MTSDEGPVGRGPRYADELTSDVVREIGDFLLPRLERAAGAHSAGSEEGITASALAETVATLVLGLELTITGGTPGRGRPPIGIPPPSVPTEEECRVRAELRLDRLRNDWNHLCLLAGYWRTAPGYQELRRHRLEFRDAEHERWYHQQLSRSRPESCVMRPPRQE